MHISDDLGSEMDFSGKDIVNNLRFIAVGTVEESIGRTSPGVPKL
jgi:hypothetical protein